MTDVEPSRDWAVEAADRVVDLVDLVRDRTTGPALKAARWVVYGVAMLVVLIPTLVGIIIGLIRLIDVMWDKIFEAAGVDGGAEIWVTYLTLGLIFLGAGFFAWSKRFPETT